jgi:hypothetical protein
MCQQPAPAGRAKVPGDRQYDQPRSWRKSVTAWPSCSSATRQGGSPPTSPSCRSCCEDPHGGLASRSEPQTRTRTDAVVGDVDGYAPGLIINLSVHLLIPDPISPREMDGIEQFVRWGAARLGGLAMYRVIRALRYLLAFCVWLGGMYLMAMINDALFAIFLGSSMIMGGIYIPPRSRRGRPEQSASAYQ